MTIIDDDMTASALARKTREDNDKKAREEAAHTPTTAETALATAAKAVLAVAEVALAALPPAPKLRLGHGRPDDPSAADRRALGSVVEAAEDILRRHSPLGRWLAGEHGGDTL